ncbi:prepilin-type N-terminal cleavage/methylation domain-containing protein [Neptunicella sp. SCSIO 80796]|uniref:prepilin-type N-terminal cleavage/methylation domain-containing protein n=1 Tax=Neptunicella plasticusilytica TaxID=3117012 RepID=UPI003A4E0A67
MIQKLLPSNAGFTLIELIIVIVILGILAVTAAPKFIDISEDATAAVTKSQYAGFKTAINLVYAKSLMNPGSTLTVGSDTYSIDESGWPTGTGSGSAMCADLWNKLYSDPQPVATTNDPNGTLAKGWNTFGYDGICAYGNSANGESFLAGNLPFFVYFYKDFNLAGYSGSAGDVTTYNM